MAAAFAGKWEHIKNENIEDYFRAIGITDEMMAQIGKLAAVLEIVVEGDKITTKGKTDTTFELGKEFDDVMITGDVLKSTAVLDGNKIIVSSVAPSGNKGSRTFELVDDGLVISLAADNAPVVGKRFYKKVA